jgi:hypothetical protein
MDKQKIVTVCPAGRRRYMELLTAHLKYQHSLGAIDEHNWWINTENPPDVAFMKKTAKENPWIKCIEGVKVNGIFSIPYFYPHAADPNTIYIKIDDDIVWMHPMAITNMIKCRLENPEPLLICGSVVNSSLCNYQHQQKGCIPKELGELVFETGGIDWAWDNGPLAEKIHNCFLEKYDKGETEDYFFPDTPLDKYQRVSINCICWLGSTMKQLLPWPSIVFEGLGDEDWLTMIKSKEIQIPNIMCGSALMSHFSYFTHRRYLDQCILLTKYYDMIPKT